MIDFRKLQIVDLTQAIKDQSYRLGFSLAGITRPDPLPHAEVFEDWLKQGRQGEMDYLASPRSRRCRAYPREILPECRSVLVLAMRYPAPPRFEPKGKRSISPHGTIAAYAWGEDYHSVIAERLSKLVEFITSQVGHPISNRWYADTGPVLERELAQRAGLGWIGKNTCLISPGQGSYFFLAEVLLGVELEPDQPFTADRCGTCQRCLTACPTGCILPDRTLDARRCISYLTIELKGAIPPELRPLLGMLVFGCDICQQACPWNRFATAEVDPAFQPHRSGMEVDLLEEISLTPAEFKAKFRHSPLLRAGRRSYLRNVAVALGNLGNQEAVDAIDRALTVEQEPLVRLHSAWALAQIGGEQAIRALEAALEFEVDLLVRTEIQSGLAHG